MGLFDKILGKNNEASEAKQKVNWIPLKDESQLDDIVKKSKEKAVVIFKHSTRCSISASVINRFEKQLGGEIDAYYLDLLNYREISNAIADKFNIVHQSPQAIVFQEGKVDKHASHYDILELL